MSIGTQKSDFQSVYETQKVDIGHYVFCTLYVMYITRLFRFGLQTEV